MKRAISSIAIFLICIVFSGCVPHTELNEKAIIEALGIDYDGKNYKVTMQYYNLSGSGSKTQIDTSQSNVLIASGTGKDIYSALERAEFVVGRELMMGINQMVIIGREATKQSLLEIMSFATTYYQSHPKMLVCTADKKAEDILKVKFVEGTVSTQKLKYILRNAERSGIVKLVTVLDVFIGLESKQQNLCLPLLSAVETGTDASEDGKNVEIKGCTLYKNAVAEKDLDLDEAAGFALLRGAQIGTATVTTSASGEEISIGVYDIITNVRPHFDGEKLTFKITLNAHGKFLDSYSGGKNNELTKVLGEDAAQKLVNRMKKVINAAILENSADIFRFDVILRHYDYKAWKKLHENWDEVIKDADFQFEAKVVIDRYGLEE